MDFFVCVPHECCKHRGQKKVLNPPELALQTVVNYHVGAGNLT